MAIHPVSIAAGPDLSRYAPLEEDLYIPQSPLAPLINHLETTGLLPESLGVLLRNNHRDSSFLTHTLITWVTELREQRLLGNKALEELRKLLIAGQLKEALKFLGVVGNYLVLSSKQTTEIRLLPVSEYSDHLIRYSTHKLSLENRLLEEKIQREFIVEWIHDLARRFPQLPKDKINSAQLSVLSGQNDQVQRSILELVALTTQDGNQLRSIISKELESTLRAAPKGKFIQHAYLTLSAERHAVRALDKLKACRLELQSGRSMDVQELTRLYNGTVFLLKDLKSHFLFPSETRFCQLVGEMGQTWIEINTLCKANHIFCGCQAKGTMEPGRLAKWPGLDHPLIDPKVSSPSSDIQPGVNQRVLFFGCNWGGGHKSATEGAANAFLRQGYHIHTMDLPESASFLETDLLHRIGKIFGKAWSAGTLYNALLKDKAFSLINFFRWINEKMPETKESRESKIKIIAREILKVNPNIVVSTYAMHSPLVHEAVKMLGLPQIHVVTDVDSGIDNFPEQITYPHFRIALPYGTPIATQGCSRRVAPEQREVTGPPVRKEFLQERKPEEIGRLRAKWNISQNKKVVVITNGNGGAATPFPELLARHYSKTPEGEIPYHVVVLCGKENKSFLRHLEKDVSSKTNLPMTLLEYANATQMEELMTLAADGGTLVGKPGGLTTFETTTRGTRLLVDNTPVPLLAQGLIQFIGSIFSWFGWDHSFSWERVNCEFAEQNGLALVCNSRSEFLSLLAKITSHNGPQPRNFEIKNYQQELPRVGRELIGRSDADREIQRLRAANTQWI